MEVKSEADGDMSPKVDQTELLVPKVELIEPELIKKEIEDDVEEIEEEGEGEEEEKYFVQSGIVGNSLEDADFIKKEPEESTSTESSMHFMDVSS